MSNWLKVSTLPRLGISSTLTAWSISAPVFKYIGAATSVCHCSGIWASPSSDMMDEGVRKSSRLGKSGRWVGGRLTFGIASQGVVLADRHVQTQNLLHFWVGAAQIIWFWNYSNYPRKKMTLILVKNRVKRVKNEFLKDGMGTPTQPWPHIQQVQAHLISIASGRIEAFRLFLCQKCINLRFCLEKLNIWHTTLLFPLYYYY